MPPAPSLTPLRATGLYLLTAIAFTWPLATGLTRDIPWDLGDSLLNCWILAWDADHLLRLASGDVTALSGFWNANIFHPEPLALAYSEHLFAQAVQILPIYALTRNIILCYNLLFLSTFVLSGLGMFLCVREITGSRRAAFAAGLIYAFAPLRIPQFAHVQVLSSQWMPFALYGLRRYFDTRQIRPLVGAGAALVAQNLSCGYFLIYFAPCIAAYVLFEVASRRLWHDWRVWGALGATAVGVAIDTIPFLLPYVELRQMGSLPRSIAEVQGFAADVFSYWTAPAESHLWGRLVRSFPKAEGDLFPSATALALGLVGLGASLRTAWTESRGGLAVTPKLRPLVYALAISCAACSVSLVAVLSGHGFAQLGPLPISIRGLDRSALLFVSLLAILAAVSPRVGSFARGWLGSTVGFAVLAALFAFFMSLGPQIHTSGRAIQGSAPYGMFYEHVAGFDGLRVPARYGMIVMVFLSIAAGCGAALVERRLRHGGRLIVLMGFLAVAESFAAPIVINGTGPEAGLAPPPSRVYTGALVPPVYTFLKTLPRPGTVIAEFPLGQWAYELRYLYYSTEHWHPLINGYSGTFPLSYSLRAAVLRRPEDNPQSAWDALAGAGVTHAVVHETSYHDGQGKAVSAWLAAHGATLVAEFDGDKVFRLR